MNFQMILGTGLSFILLLILTYFISKNLKIGKYKFLMIIFIELFLTFLFIFNVFFLSTVPSDLTGGKHLNESIVDYEKKDEYIDTKKPKLEIKNIDNKLKKSSIILEKSLNN